MCGHAAAQGCKSIAMPAMGTGRLAWPADLVARTRIDSLLEFDRAHGPNGPLKDVRFIVYDKDINSSQVGFLLVFLFAYLNLSYLLN